MNSLSTNYSMKNHSQNIASITVNLFAKIIEFNSKAIEVFPNITTNSNIFDYFSEERSQLLEVFFLESKNKHASVSEEISIESNIGELKYTITIQPDPSDDNLYTFTFREVEEQQISEGIKFKVNVPIDEKIGNRKDVIRILDLIKASYPFSFIEKNNLQREINKIEDFFWIKDKEGKYSIVNNSFAKVLGLKPIQVEGRNVDEFIPPFLANINRSIEKYLIETSNAVIVEGVFNSFLNNFEEDKEIIEYPICDIDNKVIAIIGLSNTIKENGSDSLLADTINSMQQAVVVIDSSGNINNYNDELKNLFGIKGDSNLRGLKISSVAPTCVSTNLKRIIDNITIDVEIEENFICTLKNKGDIKVFVKSIVHSNKKDKGLIVTFNKVEEENIINESKVKMYDVMMKSSPEPIFIYDVENLKFLKVNKAAQKLYGYSQEEFLQLDLTDLYTPEDIQTLLQSSDSAAEEGSYTGPWRHQRKDGSTILVEISKFSYDYKGKHTHINLVRDVTNDIKKERELKVLKASLENTGDIILSVDSDGFVTECNKTINKYLNFEAEEVIGRPLLSLVSDNERSRISSEILNAGITNTNSFKYGFKKNDGTIIEADLIVTPIVNYSGDVDSYNIVIKPIPETSVKNDTETLESNVFNNMHDMAPTELNKNFLSHLFHEILTPINVIMGFVQELTDSIEVPTDEQQEATTIIKENQKRLLSLMDNVIEYVEMGDEEIELNTETVTFVDMLDDLEEAVKKPLKQNNIEFGYGRISTSLVLETDKQKLATFLSLLIKIISEVTKENKIILSAASYDSEYTLISFKDNKSAITQDLLKVLNEIFKSDEDTIRKNYGISRLTMRLVHKLIKVLSVELLVVSKGNKPAEFGLLLPSKIEEESIQITKLQDLEELNGFNPIDKKDVVEEKEEKAELNIDKNESVKETDPIATIHPIKNAQDTNRIEVNVNVQAPEPTISESEEVTIADEPETKKWTAKKLSEMSCLYLEDQVDSQILFKVQMKDIHKIDFAVSFEEALPLLKSQKYDFIIMDINLKGEYNGLDALKMIKSMPGYNGIPVIASTAYVLPGDREKFINFGFSDFISKPVMRDNIVDTLDGLFN